MSDATQMLAEVIADADAWASHSISDVTVQRAVDALCPYVAEPGEPAQLSVLLTNDTRMRELNAQFREKDKATNVLSFPSGDAGYIGDIALGVETVVREAAEQGVSVADHVTHLVIHGTLHLLGYDHVEDDEAQEMEQLEVSVLKDLDIEDPYNGCDLHTEGVPSEMSGEIT